ncbi:MAG: flavin-containing monooxygenase [Nocardioides sp.]
MFSNETVDTIVIGAGHAGLAVSRLLSAAGHDHVVLERGRVGERWRSERWDSLHLLTPAWMTRLPGWTYAGADPDGYLTKDQLVRLLEMYAGSFDAPLLDDTTVLRVDATGRAASDPSAPRYRVVTDGGTLHSRQVVVATGPHGRPVVPAGLAGPEGERWEYTPLVVPANRYRTPDRLAPGGVLVVGASSTGTQIADELSRAGREVVLAVGRHTRTPRRYRGMDAFWWLEVTGRLARTIDTMPDPVAARREPSMQLVGRNDPDGYARDLDLGVLQRQGVRLVGRLLGAEGRTLRFDDGLDDTVADADARMHRFLDAVDVHVEATGLSREVWDPVRPAPVPVPHSPDRVDLRAEGIGTVVLATGYRPDNRWLRLPVTDADGSIRQRRGVTELPGLYVVGQRFQHRRDSGFIGGARHDATAVVRHLLGHAESARELAAAGEALRSGEETAS